MGRAYSMDLRERAVAAVQAGESRHVVADRFGLDPSCVVKWMLLLEATGSVAPRKMGGHRPYALAAHRAFVLQRIAEKPDLTIDELHAELAENGIMVGRFAVWNFLKHEKLSFKKKPPRRRAGQAGRRQKARTLEKTPGKARS